MKKDTLPPGDNFPQLPAMRRQFITRHTEPQLVEDLTCPNCGKVQRSQPGHLSHLRSHAFQARQGSGSL